MQAADLMTSQFSTDTFHLAMILLVGLFLGLWSIMIKHE
jgi:hypothetical protein